MNGYEQVLQGVAGLFHASENVTRKKFHSYVSSLNIEKNWPGIQGIGFSIPVTVGDKAKHIRDIRNEGFPEYTIKPEADREEYSAIIYLEPFDWRNKRAFGYDMWSNDMRREAMARARDTGKASTSGIITLVQETDIDVQKGFLTYLPLYQDGVSLETIEQRRRAFIGWVYSPFRMGDLMAGILGSDQTEIEYEIFDGDSVSKETMLFDSNKSFHEEYPFVADALMKTVVLEVQGRKWTLHFTTGRNAQGVSKSRQPMIVAIAGLVVSFSLFFIVSSLVLRQKYAEEIAQKRTSQLAVTNKELVLLKSALDQHAIVSITDVKGDITYVNDKFCEISGYSRAELMGMDQRIVRSDEHSGEFYSDLWATIENGKIWNGEIKNKRKGGGFYWLDATIVPFFNEKGKPFKYISIRTDITEKKQTEKNLRQSQKMEAVGQLTGGIAHDFNNMLGIIMGNLELLRRKVKNDPNALKFIDAAYAGGERGAKITKKLLSFSRHASEDQTLVNVNELIDGMTDLICKSVTPKIILETYLADDVRAVNINPDDFDDTLLNLAINARDAMPGGGTLVIETKNKTLDDQYVQLNPGCAVGDYVLISISDTGIGMEPDVVEQVFQPFFTTKEIGKGTGLGMSMVYGFIQRSKGHVKIYSEPGRGTTIRLYLPCTDQGTGDVDHVTDNGATGLVVGKETILVVDDEQGLANVAVAYLEDLGYTTLAANSGQQALEVLQEHPKIDLLFSDVVMPGEVDGYDLAKETMHLYPTVKVLLTSGFTAKREGAVNGDIPLFKKLTNDLLNKPYNQTELAQAVRNILDKED